MADSHTVTGLIAKRAELAGEAQKLSEEVERKLRAIDAIEEVLKVLDPELDLRRLVTKRARARSGIAKEFSRGECRRLVYDALRGRVEPVPTAAIVNSVAGAKSLSERHEEVAFLVKAILGRLYEKRRVLRSVDPELLRGHRWALA